MDVYYPYPPSEPIINEFIGKLDSNINVEFSRSPINQYQVLICGKPSNLHLNQSKKLKFVIVPYAGPCAGLISRLSCLGNIKLYRAPFNALAVAEMALSLLFSVSKNIVLNDKSLRVNNWKTKRKNIILRNKSVLILGYGYVGKEISKLCNAIGMKVTILNRTGKSESEEPNSAHRIKSLDNKKVLRDEIKNSDILICALPSTSKTTNLISTKEFLCMNSETIIINVGRANVIDELQLYLSLKNNLIFGAGLDVWYREADRVEKEMTFPSTYNFSTLDNVVMSPHCAWKTTDSETLRIKTLAHSLNQLNQHGDAPFGVNLELGY